MKTLFEQDNLQFKRFLKERVSNEDDFEFFITSGPDCDFEVQTDINHLLFALKSDRKVEYQCFIEDGTILEIFTTKVPGYANKDGIKFGLRSKSSPSTIFSNELIRSLLGISFLVKVDNDEQSRLIESELMENGYPFIKNHLNHRGIIFQMEKHYGHLLVATPFLVNSTTLTSECQKMFFIAQSVIEDYQKLKV